MSTDGGLRKIFRSKFKTFQWTSVETGAVSPGTPDAEYCAPGGKSGWVEFKACSFWKVTFQPLQTPWINRRARLGGRVFIAIRRAENALYLVPGSRVIELAEDGLKKFDEFRIAGEGARNWDWAEVERRLLE